jgi:hypothetical protein
MPATFGNVAAARMVPFARQVEGGIAEQRNGRLDFMIYF